MKDIKTAIQRDVDRQRNRLIDLSRRIHDNPEPGFHEFKASTWLTEYLGENGFGVKKGIYGLETAFEAVAGSGKPRIALLGEYDALPKMGHGCGHNIIAVSAAGAAVAAKLAIEQYGGTLLMLGTPAEELYGGKAIMAEQGAFGDIDMAMMVHPGNKNTAITKALACIPLEIEFFGKAAHAAARPEQGINALEAMVQSFAAINSLRQHIKPSARVHGIITDGGEAANIVPAHSAGSFLVRAEDEAYLVVLKDKVLNCFKGAATATGARLKYRWDKAYYAPMRTNYTMAKLFATNMETLGLNVNWMQPETGFGSTDMGNVSQLVPSIHAFVAIAPPGVATHSTEFASCAASDSGWEGLILAAKAMAMTACDLFANPGVRQRVRREFRSAMP